MIWRPSPPRPPALFLSEPKASERFWEFFTANIRNRNTRRAYHKAACRFSDSLFDWLVVGHIMAVNPAHAVRGPKHSVRKDKTPVLTAEEARTLLDSIPVMRTVKLKGGEKKEVHCVVGLCDRALIGLTVFTYARVGAAVGMKVEDYFIQGRRGWVRLHEKGGKRHDVPANHNLDEYLEAYIKGVDQSVLLRIPNWARNSGLLIRRVSKHRL